VLELRVVNLYKQGVSVKEIVKQMELSRATVYRILKKYRAAQRGLSVPPTTVVEFVSNYW